MTRGDGATGERTPLRWRVSARGVGAIATLALAAVLGPASAASAAELSGPKEVTPGKRVTFKLSGATPSAGIFLQLGPTKNRNGNCCGRVVKVAQSTDAAGGATLRFVWPRRYDTCGIDSERLNCHASWKRGSRADITVCAGSCVGGPVREVVRIRKGAPIRKRRGRTPRVRKCRRVVIEPRSGNVFTKVRVQGIGCQSARRMLRSWTQPPISALPQPPGYTCRVVTKYPAGNDRRRCRRSGRRFPAIAFDTGF